MLASADSQMPSTQELTLVPATPSLRTTKCRSKLRSSPATGEALAMVTCRSDSRRVMVALTSALTLLTSFDSVICEPPSVRT